jgi:Uma2 family endonuclease
MGATQTGLITVEQFRSLPEAGPVYYELRGGELVPVTRPTFKHHRIQWETRELLASAAGADWIVSTEFAFRPQPEHELRVADVACISRERWEQIDLEDNLHGAPDLVIEVLSPSNTADELLDKQKICLENGCREFWVVDPKRCQVIVSTPDGAGTTYRSGQEIPLPLFGGGTLPVDGIFT